MTEKQPVLCFSCGVLSGCGIGVMLLASEDEFGSVPTTCIFLEGFKKTWFSFSLNIWKNSAMKPSAPGLFFAGRFLIFDSISLLLMAYQAISS